MEPDWACDCGAGVLSDSAAGDDFHGGASRRLAGVQRYDHATGMLAIDPADAADSGDCGPYERAIRDSGGVGSDEVQLPGQIAVADADRSAVLGFAGGCGAGIDLDFWQ